MTLFWHQTGPKISYGNGILKIEDLNPQVEINWLMSRWQLLGLCLRGLRAVIVCPKGALPSYRRYHG